MKISLSASGLFDPRQFDAWSAARHAAIRSALRQGMTSGGRLVRDEARAQMRRAFKVRRNSFITSMQARVLDKNADQFPALVVGSKIPWLGLHQQGGTVSGNLLIPLLPGRLGPKKFKAIIDSLLKSGNAFFIEKNGKVILMAENLRENTPQLKRFKQAERARSGVKQIKRGQEIPIAVLVNSVSLRRRLDLPGAVQRTLPRLAHAIRTEFNKIG